MAIPYLFEERFANGTKGLFNTETDTESRLDFAHYAELARVPGMGMPFRDAYAVRVNLANDGSPADALLQEEDGFDAAAQAVVFVRFAFWLSRDTVMANTNEFAIFQIWSSTNTVEGGVYINYTTANGFRVGIGETSATSFRPLTLGEWHQFELQYTVDNAGANDGALAAWLDGVAMTGVGSLDQGAITSAVYGVMGQDAGTTAGTLLLGEIAADDTRLYPITDRYPHIVELTASGHVFVGPGTLENVTLNSGADANSVLRVFDTDTGNVNDLSNLKLELTNTAADEPVDPAGTPIYLKRGCFVQLAPTDATNHPRATAKICKAVTHSDGAKRNYGLRRTPHPVLG